MFNIYTFEKKIAQDDELKKMKEEFVKEEQKRKIKQAKLVNNYNKRIENFVLHMTEKPLKTQDLSPSPHKIREEDPSRFVGPANVVIRSFKHEKDRIREAIERNKEYRADGSAIQFEFRKRDTTREIQPQMHFTTKSNLERVVERIQDAMIDSGEGKAPEKMPEAFFTELSKSPKLMNQYLAKHVMPEMNVKTHFKAARTLAYCSQSPPRDKIKTEPAAAGQTAKLPKNIYDSPTSPKTNPPDTFNSLARFGRAGNVSPNRRQDTSVGFDEEKNQEQKQAEKQPHVEVVNPAEASKKVLLNCNITRNKPLNAHSLKMGEGHLIGMSDTSLGDIYRNIYNRSIDPRASI